MSTAEGLLKEQSGEENSVPKNTFLKANCARADLHIHSKYSDRPSQWWLRRIGAPECYVEPRELYEKLTQRGMNFITITDHNCIRGALEIAELPRTFVSAEITTYFPETETKIHVLVWDITEAQFAEIERLRPNIYDLQQYLVTEDILHAVAHPLFRINDRLSVGEVEKLLLLFKRFELINGSRDAMAADLFRRICNRLTAELINDLASDHRLEPAGPAPWEKWFTGGSDDHSGLYGGAAFTQTPPAQHTAAFLNHLREGRHEPGGETGGTLRLARTLYAIAHRYYSERFLRNGPQRPSALKLLFEKVLKDLDPAQRTRTPRFWNFFNWRPGFWKRKDLRKRSPLQWLNNELAWVLSQRESRQALTLRDCDWASFALTNKLANVITEGSLQHLVEHFQRGDILRAIESLGALSLTGLGIAPYITSFHLQSKDRRFLARLSRRFDVSMPGPGSALPIAWFTDTFDNLNGVSRTVSQLLPLAEATEFPLELISCGTAPDWLRCCAGHAHLYQPIFSAALPDYETIQLRVPPPLEVFQLVEQRGFGSCLISTPGPVGVIGLLTAKLLNLPCVGIYHTDFYGQVARITGESELARLVEAYVRWLYGHMDRVLVPTEFYRRKLIEEGFPAEKLGVWRRGVDCEKFSPNHRVSDFWKRRGLLADVVLLYVGRVSEDKGLEVLWRAFQSLSPRYRSLGLAVVGDGPSLKEYRARWNHPRVRFIGRLEGDELSAAYASADIFVFPSLTDTFGNVVLEAQASGLPVVVAEDTASAEVAGDGAVGFKPGQAECLARTVEQLLANPGRYLEVRQQALRRVEGMTWKNALQELSEHAQQTWHEYFNEPDRVEEEATRNQLTQLFPLLA